MNGSTERSRFLREIGIILIETAREHTHTVLHVAHLKKWAWDITRFAVGTAEKERRERVNTAKSSHDDLMNT